MAGRRPENRIDAPGVGQVTPPPGVLRELRRIDPKVDLHYIGAGRWALGTVEPNAYRRKVGGKRLNNPEVQADPRKTRMARLIYRGYQHISFYDVDPGQKDHVAKAVPDFRRRDYIYRHRWREEYHKAREASTNWRNRPTDEEMIAEIEERHRANRAVLFDGRRHFRQPGLM